MDLKGLGMNTRNWVDLAQDRDLLESPCECSNEPLGSISHGVSWFEIFCWFFSLRSFGFLLSFLFVFYLYFFSVSLFFSWSPLFHCYYLCPLVGRILCTPVYYMTQRGNLALLLKQTGRHQEWPVTTVRVFNLCSTVCVVPKGSLNCREIVKAIKKMSAVCVRFWRRNITGFGGLGVRCSPRDPRFAGSNPAEVDRFFRTKKKSWAQVLRERLQALSPESEISGLLKNLKPEKIDFWAKFNRYTHVLIPKFGEAQSIWKGRSVLGSNEHPIKTNISRKDIYYTCSGKQMAGSNETFFLFKICLDNFIR